MAGGLEAGQVNLRNGGGSGSWLTAGKSAFELAHVVEAASTQVGGTLFFALAMLHAGAVPPERNRLWGKQMNMRILLAVVTASSLLGSGAVAATPPDLCKGGQVSVLRISKLKSGDAKAQFDKAEKSQVAWYRSHGFSKNRVLVGAVMVQDKTTKEWTVSPSEIVSLHTDAPGPAAKHDAAYDAFVADYRAASDITTEMLVCLREPAK